MKLKDLLNEVGIKYLRDINFSKEELDFIVQLINNLGTGGMEADNKNIGMFALKYTKDLLKKGKGNIPSKFKSILKSVESKLNK